jgi:uncharacterized protein YbjT (DUF2867 family)
MSVLVIGADTELGSALISRLTAEDDEVRLVESDEATGARWKSLGAYVAGGRSDDGDLVERAAHGARTLILLHDQAPEVLDVLIGAARSTGARVVLCSRNLRKTAVASIRESGLDYVVLRMGRPRRLWSLRNPNVERVAQAIDAADDLAGHPHLELDLGRPESWNRLGLDPPP